MLPTFSTLDIMEDHSIPRCPEREVLIERYNRLYQECELLKSRIANSITSTPSSTSRHYSNIFSYSSPPSPVMGAMSAPWSSSQFTFSQQQQHFYTVPELLTPPSEESLDDEHSLKDVNCQIKATLTSLLNCESVKHNAQLRAWVQDRLMDAEHNIRRQRRRKSSADKDLKHSGGSLSLPGSAVKSHRGRGLYWKLVLRGGSYLVRILIMNSILHLEHLGGFIGLTGRIG